MANSSDGGPDPSAPGECPLPQLSEPNHRAYAERLGGRRARGSAGFGVLARRFEPRFCQSAWASASRQKGGRSLARPAVAAVPFLTTSLCVCCTPSPQIMLPGYAAFLGGGEPLEKERHGYKYVLHTELPLPDREAHYSKMLVIHQAWRREICRVLSPKRPLNTCLGVSGGGLFLGESGPDVTAWGQLPIVENSRFLCPKPFSTSHSRTAAFVGANCLALF